MIRRHNSHAATINSTKHSHGTFPYHIHTPLGHLGALVVRVSHQAYPHKIVLRHNDEGQNLFALLPSLAARQRREVVVEPSDRMVTCYHQGFEITFVRKGSG